MGHRPNNLLCRFGAVDAKFMDRLGVTASIKVLNRSLAHTTGDWSHIAETLRADAMRRELNATARLHALPPPLRQIRLLFVLPLSRLRICACVSSGRAIIRLSLFDFAVAVSVQRY
jgi:hypothetical protein